MVFRFLDFGCVRSGGLAEGPRMHGRPTEALGEPIADLRRGGVGGGEGEIMATKTINLNTLA